MTSLLLKSPVVMTDPGDAPYVQWPDFFLDSFDATPGSLLTAHVSDSGHSYTRVVGSGAAGPTIAPEGGAIYPYPEANLLSNWVPSSPNQWLEADVDLVGTYNQVLWGLLRCNANATSFYQVSLSTVDQFLRIGKTVGSTYTILGTYSVSAAHPSTIRMEIEGSEIRGFLNGVQRLSLTDTSITAAGSLGIRASGLAGNNPANNNRFRGLRAGTL